MDLFLKMIRTRNLYRQNCLASLKLTANTPENRPSALKEKDRLPTKKHLAVVFAVRFRDGNRRVENDEDFRSLDTPNRILFKNLGKT